MKPPLPVNITHTMKKLACFFVCATSMILAASTGAAPMTLTSLKAGFLAPPNSAKPGVYWYFVDGNFNRDAMTEDLDSMSAAGISSVIYLEVSLGFPPGPVKFMSEEWQDDFVHAVREAERRNISISLGTGPGWAGDGGPWVKPAQSMQHLVASSTNIQGPCKFAAVLPMPEPRKPYFDTLSDELKKERLDYYKDVAVLAFPTPETSERIADSDEKALYYRAPFTSARGVKPYLTEPPADDRSDPGAIAKNQVIDLTRRLRPDGVLDWQAPPGKWTIMRFGARNNGANTRPAPKPGFGFESDKFSSKALDAHLANYTDKLLKKVGPLKQGCGWTDLHLDSWEMGAQNWTPGFRAEFERRRGYDPLPFFPAYTGAIIGSRAVTERFLWDLRLTAQELVVENHAEHLAKVAHRAGLTFSLEPYDMNPAGDLELGAAADIPMGEFWSHTGFNSSFSCIEAASVAHTGGRPVVWAESFTSPEREAMTLFPGVMKNQLDWAFAAGINRIFFHTFAHQPLGSNALPGMTFGPYGVHWDRHETWWPMVSAFHEYIARCSYVLQEGVTVADILYLTPEGAPDVFLAPKTSVEGGDPFLPDRRGYNFDGCAPETLIERATVQNRRIVFRSGTSYRVLVLPAFKTMTPRLLEKIGSLIEEGATVIGSPPNRSPSLSDFPACDKEVAENAAKIWGGAVAPKGIKCRTYGEGRIYWGGSLALPEPSDAAGLYPPYDSIAGILKGLGVPEDFSSDAPVRYTHRKANDVDIFFVANRADQKLNANCTFAVTGAHAQLWDPVSGRIYRLPISVTPDGRTAAQLSFDAFQSFFVIFSRAAAEPETPVFTSDSPSIRLTVKGPWTVAFNPKRGGPGEVEFSELEDWTQRPEEGIRYYSGIATYRDTFDISTKVLNSGARVFLDLGSVKDICRVRLNGHDLGVVWTAPWRVEIGALARSTGNDLEVEVANRWANRLIGDEQPGNKDVRTLEWPSGLLGGEPVKAGRYTYITHHYYNADSPLLPSGLLGPVTIQTIPGE